MAATGGGEGGKGWLRGLYRNRFLLQRLELGFEEGGRMLRRVMRLAVYAVRKGRKPGVYDTWGECEEQVWELMYGRRTGY